MLDQLFGFIGNPIFLMLIGFPILLLVGIYVGVWLTHPRKNRVLKIDPESGRGVDYEVSSEDRINACCDAVGDTPPQRFIKLHKAMNVIRKGVFKLQTYALWLGVVGSGYTTTIEKGKEIKVPLRKVILNLFGQELYNKIPNESPDFIKDKIERSEVGITVQIPKGNPGAEEAKLPKINSDDIIQHDTETLISALVRGVKSLGKTSGGEMLKIMFILGSGIGIGVVLSLIFKWGAPTYIEPARIVLSYLFGWIY